MKAEHVIDLLDRNSIGALSETQLSAIRIHVDGCEYCRQAYEATTVSATLLRSRAVEEVEAPVFFETRVMARLREARAGSAVPLSALWKAAGAVVSAFVAMIVVLLALAVFG